MRNQALNGWRQIDVQLKRRHDLIPNLVNAVRGSMDFERDTLTAVMEARAKALTATGPADAAQKEGQLSQALGRLLAVAENYPTLKSNDNVKMLQEELSATENKVGFARQFYNDIATRFNTAQQVFPANLFAAGFGFKPAELFEITDAAERDVPVVDLVASLIEHKDTKARRSRQRHPLCLVPCVRMNLYEQQQSNRRRTWLVMLAFVGFFLLPRHRLRRLLHRRGPAVCCRSDRCIALGVGSVSAASELLHRRSRGAARDPAPSRSKSCVAGASADDTLKLRQLREHRRRNVDRRRACRGRGSTSCPMPIRMRSRPGAIPRTRRSP